MMQYRNSLLNSAMGESQWQGGDLLSGGNMSMQGCQTPVHPEMLKLDCSHQPLGYSF